MNYKRKRPKEHVWFICGQRCRYDRCTVTGNHPFLYKVSDRVRAKSADEQIKEYNNAPLV